MFGAVNALFSGFAFAALFYAIWLQRYELRLQRLELKATRSELRGQKQQLERQNHTLKSQSFENTFFQMMSLHLGLVSTLQAQRSGSQIRGRDSFDAIWQGLRTELGRLDPNRMKSVGEVSRQYSQVYKDSRQPTGHYFRSLYNIVKFIDRSDVNEKDVYTNLVRAQLSRDELLLLFYNCLSEEGSKFKPFVEKYRLLKHLDKASLLSSSHLSWYHQNAFASTVE